MVDERVTHGLRKFSRDGERRRALGEAGVMWRLSLGDWVSDRLLMTDMQLLMKASI